MEHTASFRNSFQLVGYDFEDPIDAGRCQTAVRNFMRLVKENSLQGSGSEGLRLMTDFCRFLLHDDVWGLARMVVPEFRHSRLENERFQQQSEGDFGSLDFVLRFLDSHERLPPTRNDANFVTTEEEMLKTRYKTYVKYILTGGTGVPDLSGLDKEEIDLIRDKLSGTWYAAYEVQQKAGQGPLDEETAASASSHSED
ncbi:MAG: hypothetical protein Q9184_001896 [Pyrenodesmia sp. 2 TL-2023]